jgi:cell division protein FtsL
LQPADDAGCNNRIKRGGDMTYVKGKNFKNGGKKQVNPIYPMLLIIVLAVALILLSNFVADVTSEMYQQQQEMQSIYEEQNSGN